MLGSQNNIIEILHWPGYFYCMQSEMLVPQGADCSDGSWRASCCGVVVGERCSPALIRCTALWGEVYSAGEFWQVMRRVILVAWSLPFCNSCCNDEMLFRCYDIWFLVQCDPCRSVGYCLCTLTGLSSCLPVPKRSRENESGRLRMRILRKKFSAWFIHL